MSERREGGTESAGGTPARTGTAALGAAITYTAAVSLLFVAFPGIDLRVAALFHDADGFWAARIGALGSLRTLASASIVLVMLALLAAILAKLAWPARPLAVRPRAIVFLVASLLLGPGLLVNGLLKPFSGRPRPVQIDLFGGDAAFVPAWDFHGSCASNCSFVSGEASSAAWLLALALLAPRGFRLPAALAIGLVAFVFSLNRIAFGGHFLSDVMIAWGLTLIVVLALHRLLVEGRLGPRIDRAMEDGLGRAGLALRRALGQDGDPA